MSQFLSRPMALETSAVETVRQRRAVGKLFASEISGCLARPEQERPIHYPGASASVIYEDGKRCLIICSIPIKPLTNFFKSYAKRCGKQTIPRLTTDVLVRLGRIDGELDKEFGDFIIPDRIAERKSAELVRRKREIESELERLGKEATYAEVNCCVTFFNSMTASKNQPAKHCITTPTNCRTERQQFTIQYCVDARTSRLR